MSRASDRPDRGGKPVFGIVGQLHRLGRRAEGHGDDHRPEYLDAGNRRGGLHAGEQRRRIEAAGARHRRARLVQRRAFLQPGIDQVADALQLHRVDDGAHVDRLVERIAEPKRLHARRQLRDEALVDALLDEEPRSGAADLALVQPDRVDHPFDRRVEIGIVEDDEGRLAAELQRQALAGAGGRLADFPPDLGRAGEGDLGDARMGDDRLAGAAIAGDDVDHACRQAGLPAHLGKEQRGERGELGGLQNHRIAEGDRRRDLPSEHQEREIPRDDLPADAERLAVGKLRVHELRPTGMVVEVPGDERDVDVARLADGLAVFHRLDDREETAVALDQAGERVEILGPFVARQRRPCRLRPRGGLDRGIDVRGRRLCHARKNLAGGRRDGLEALAAGRLLPGPAHEQPGHAAEPLDPGARIPVALRRRTIFHRLEDFGDRH